MKILEKRFVVIIRLLMIILMVYAIFSTGYCIYRLNAINNKIDNINRNIEIMRYD